ncbi:MAG: InlB B-repeat-containing protein, partial [Clostridia bacterium]|nr:InlB B-repeat-containing protein [Clostridia bacterium]
DDRQVTVEELLAIPVTQELIIAAVYREATPPAPVTHTVAFLDRDGEPIGEPVAVEEGECLTAALIPEAPEVAGHEFDRWKIVTMDDRLVTVEELLAIPVTQDLLIVAVYREVTPPAPVTHTVTFLDEDGEPIGEPVEVLHGMPVNVPTSETVVYSVSEIGEIDAITDDVEIILIATPVADVEAASIVINKTALDGYTILGGANQNYGLVLHAVGHGVTTDAVKAVGDVSAYFQYNAALGATGSYAIVKVTVDGIEVRRFRIDASQTAETAASYNMVITNVPMGDHVISYEIVELGGDDYASYKGIVTSIVYYNRVPDLSNVHTVTFKDKDGSVIGAPVSVEHGQRLTAGQIPTAPAVEDKDFAGWQIEGTEFVVDQATLLATPVEDDYVLIAAYVDAVPRVTVTFKDTEGNTLKTQTVKAGENVTTPTSAEVIWYGYDPAALRNVQESKEIVLQSVSQTLYAPYTVNSTQLNPTVNGTDSQTAYQFVCDGVYQPAAGWGCVMNSVDDYLEFTGDIAGVIGARIAIDRVDRAFTLEIRVDGVVYDTVVFSTVGTETINGWYVVTEGIAPGVHTVRITLSACEGEGLGGGSGLNVVGIGFGHKR